MEKGLAEEEVWEGEVGREGSGGCSKFKVKTEEEEGPGRKLFFFLADAHTHEKQIYSKIKSSY